jgi:uncharacterized protein (TIGR02646 family)
MRYIALKDKPDQAWLDKANDLLEQLKAAPDANTRHEIIDTNSKFWGELKPWLLSMSHDKCWFSEAKDCFSHWDVEHYRPKKSAKDEDGTEYEGYWWLAFDWKNFRICGNAGNRKKGTFFPLRAGCTRVTLNGDERLEDPVLLDPTDDDDPNLLSFNMEGRAVPLPGLSDAWAKHRVEYSIERYNLDFPPLMDKRKVVWQECWQRIQEYLNEISKYEQSNHTNPVAREKYKEKMNALRAMIYPDKELSAVARACILSSGDPRIMNILQSS